MLRRNGAPQGRPLFDVLHLLARGARKRLINN
jgi:hypothetical protein